MARTVNVQWNLNITLSKMAAILILLVCAGFSFAFQNPGILTLGVTVSAGMFGFRQGMNTIKTVSNGKQNGKALEHQPYEEPKEE